MPLINGSRAIDSADVIRGLADGPSMESNINHLCALCEGLHFDSTVGPERPLIRHHNGLEALNISAQDGCHLCTLMLSALRWSATLIITDEPQHGEVMVGLTWSFSLFQILLDVTCGEWKTELLLLDFSNPMAYNVPSERVATTWEKRHEYSHSAEISSDPSSDRIFSQISLWLHNCSTTHQRCHSMEAGTTLLPTRVIDVGPPDGTQNPRLKITSTMEGDYIVLSHCWGRAPMLTTTLSELDNRVDGISMDLLPKNFQDAVKITRKLGLRYLWLDSLCIIQDSTQDWEQESALMGKYYANAWLTISADAALDGILNDRSILEITPCEHPRLLKTDEVSEEGRLILPNIGSFVHNVQEGPLSKRGWILQERVLSRRILHWCRHELYWECTELQASERRPEGVEQSLWKGHHIAQLLRTLQASHSINVATPIQPSPGKESQNPDLPLPIQPTNAAYKLRPQLLDDAYRFWYELLEDFCKRNLTVGRDKLPAISGLANSFERLFLSDTAPIHGYVAGLWATDLPIGLAWRVSLQWTTHVKQGGLRDKTGRVNTACRVPFYRAPSFSWASIDGPVEHPYLDSIKRSRTSVPGFEPDILDVAVMPAGVDLFGQVVGGRVKLRGFTKAFKDLPKLSSCVYLDESREIDSLSVRDQTQGPWTCLCLGVVTHNKGDPTTYAYCLLLEATGPEHEEYRRIGLVDTVNSECFKDCARRDILIV